MRGCVVPGCLALAKYVPAVSVKLPDNDIPFKLDFANLCICQKHKDEYTIDNIITPSRFIEVQNLFRLANLGAPKKEYMKLEWLFDSFKSSIPLFDSLGKPLGDIKVINTVKGEKV